MELDDRKLKILQTIIRTYLETGEPVGSRTISKDTDLNLSSATIRNEMSDLEEMGYIIQPHTSAGRVPSDKGYRLYVDTMFLFIGRRLSIRAFTVAWLCSVFGSPASSSALLIRLSSVSE